MIEAAVSHVANELNQHLKRRLDGSESRVVVSHLFDHNVTVPARMDNKLVLLLVNIDNDTEHRNMAFASAVNTRRAPVHDNECQNRHVLDIFVNL